MDYHTINKILKRYGLITRAVSKKHQRFCRFEDHHPISYGKWISKAILL